MELNRSNVRPTGNRSVFAFLFAVLTIKRVSLGISAQVLMEAL
jgi:hypothetical protein